MTTLNPSDIMHLEDYLTAEEKKLQKQVHDYVKKNMLPNIVNWNRNIHQFPTEVAKGLTSMGVVGATIKGYGCAGVSNTAYGLMNYEVEYCDSAFRSFVSVQSGLVMHPISEFGSEEQRKKYLPKLASGEFIGCFGLTEKEAGSDPSGIQTTAKKTNGGYILNGQKKWITLSPIANVFIVWAKDDEGKIRGFILDKGMKGLTAPLLEEKYVIRAICAGLIEMDNVFVPEANVMPKAIGLKCALSCLNRARFGICWGAMGAAQACFDIILKYTKERKQFGVPLASKQLIQTKLANMATEITLGKLLIMRISKLMDEGKLDILEIADMISMAKRNNVGKAIAICREARDMMGAEGVNDANHIIRHATNLEAVNTYEGTYDIHGLILGKALTDLSSF